MVDASALIAFLRAEAGASRVAAYLDQAVISAVNWAEVAQRAIRDSVDPGDVLSDLLELDVTVAVLDEGRAMAAAHLCPVTQGAGLSLADRACLALAIELQVPAVTADRAWTTLDLPAQVICVR